MTTINTNTKGISGSTLKLIAIIAMLIDHIGACIILPMLSTNPALDTLYYALRLCGRIAFPIFCFLLVEGFFHTKNVQKYCFRLAIFALISEIPFDLAIYNTAFYWDSQNVFFTLLIGLLTIWAMQYVDKFFVKNIVLQAIFRGVILIIGMFLAWGLKTDYNLYGVIIIAVLYEYYHRRTLSVIISCFMLCMMSTLELTAFIAVPLIALYNGKRGLSLKYVFYIFYPLHLFILYIVNLM
ncbi:MAG: conjugal transfer protein TraX [Lachnospiraceae bacterium]|nr:conjugal transfer protein TraX [Lachnospiraceae bacterium]